MKKLFEDAELELIRFNKADILTSSSEIEETEAPDTEDPDDDVIVDSDTAPQSDEGGFVTDMAEIPDI